MSILGKIIYYPLFFFSLVLACILVLSGWSGHLSVNYFPLLSLADMAFPVIFLVNLGILIAWLLFRPRASWQSIIALLLVIPPAYTYSPLSFRSSTHECAEGEIKLLSYNTFSFGLWKKIQGGAKRDNPILQYISDSNSDIVCLQEVNWAIAHNYLLGENNIMAELPHSRRSQKGNLLVMSRWPIIETHDITFEGTRNRALYCRILLDNNDTLAVYNCHLQSFRLSQDDIDEYNNLITHPQNYKEYGNSKNTLRKLMTAGVERAGQADMIADMLQKETARYIILCGDFNDTPLSYSHCRISGILTDAYRKAGAGPGISYNSDRFYFRIDHAFCNGSLIPLSCRIDRSITTSDHYPVITHLKMQR